MIKNKLGHLGKFDIFYKLDLKSIALFQDKITFKDIESDAILVKEGESGKSLILLMDGEVSITQALTLMTTCNEEDTREKEVIKLSSENYPVFGEVSLFSDNNERTATITTLTNCKVGYLTQDDLFQICESHSQIGFQVLKNVLKLIGNHLIKANNNVLKLTTALSLIVEK
jgi:CRP/FNR family transcriptional regulator, cyclic AMP receptor protein